LWRETVDTIYARVVLNNCSACRDLLLEDCRENDLPLPAGEIILLPERWIKYECPHEQRFKIQVVSSESDEGPVEGDEAEAWCVEAPDGWMNIDATKNIGYPAREQGRYGSHATHDDFDDESEP
jgi:hypothetical protein